jgi:hypothetical protein
MTGPTVRPGLVERVARAIANVNSGDVNPNWPMWRDHATAALAASGIEEMRGALDSMLVHFARKAGSKFQHDAVAKARAALSLDDGMGGEG